MTAPGLARTAAGWAIVCSGVAAGGWLALIRPISSDLDDARAKIIANRNEIAAVELLTGETSHDETHASALQDFASSLNNTLSQTSDGAAIYDRIVRIAERSGVQVDRIDPRGHGEAAGELGEGKQSVQVSRLSYQIGVTGPFAEVVEFVRLMQFDSGETSVGSVRVIATPGSGGEVVSAVLETSHYQFDYQL